MKTLGRIFDAIGWTLLLVITLALSPVLILIYLFVCQRWFRVVLIGALAVFLLLWGLPELLGPRVPVAVCP